MPLASSVFMYSSLFFYLVSADSDYAKKHSSRVVQTKYGKLRGIIISFGDKNMNPVEAYLGVPYASPPVGNLRFMPPMTPAIWNNIKITDSFKPVCPQLPLSVENVSRALNTMPRSRYEHLRLLSRFLDERSEDCLHLNIFVPYRGIAESPDSPFPVLVFIHGDSYDWGSGNPYDGSMLASYGRILVITVNFRLGVLGFLRTGTRSSQMGNFGLLDQIAALHWIKENIEYFDGDKQRITILGHDRGASFVNLLLTSPVTKELISRGIMLSGSILSTWGLVKHPWKVKEFVAKQFNCSYSDIEHVDIAPCLRRVPLSDLLNLSIPTSRFQSTYAPYADGAVVSSDLEFRMEKRGGVFESGELLLCVTNVESFHLMSDISVQYGINSSYRDAMLKLFVQDSFDFHLHKIYASIFNEYTEWDKPLDDPINIRNFLLRVVSDGNTLAGVTKVAKYHARRNGKTFFGVFEYETSAISDNGQLGTVHGADLPFIFGFPLIDGGSLFPGNYSSTDISISELVMTFFSNFVKTGNPNEPIPHSFHVSKDKSKYKNLEWPEYTADGQKYLSISSKPKIKSHYRAHEIALWINLIPALHTSDNSDKSSVSQHPQAKNGIEIRGEVQKMIDRQSDSFRENIPNSEVFASNSNRNVQFDPYSYPASTPLTLALTSPKVSAHSADPNKPHAVHSMTSTQAFNESEVWWLPRALYTNYTIALMVIIIVGSSLLFLNVLVFAGVCYHRSRMCAENRAVARKLAANDPYRLPGDDNQDTCRKSSSTKQVSSNHCHSSYATPHPIPSKRSGSVDFPQVPSDLTTLYAEMIPNPPPPPKSPHISIVKFTEKQQATSPKVGFSDKVDSLPLVPNRLTAKLHKSQSASVQEIRV